MHTIYLEKEIIDHPKTKQILQKFKNSRIIEIEKYTDLFNRSNQNFRKQKEFGANIILAKKKK